MILEDLHKRDEVLLKSVLVMNLEVKDNHEEAAMGARLALDLCEQTEAVESWEDLVDDVLLSFENKHCRKLIYGLVSGHDHDQCRLWVWTGEAPAQDPVI